MIEMMRRFRRRLWVVLARLFHTLPRVPHTVHIEWEQRDGVRAVREEFVLRGLPRNVAGRRCISALLGTRNWVWVSDIRIHAQHRRIIPPQGGSGTAPPKLPTGRPSNYPAPD